ncbi:MAG: hypothetical protein AAGD10_17360 [Myxococcota bacterium]
MKKIRLRTGPGLAGIDAVGRDEGGRVVFVEGAAPNEDVRVELFAEKKRHARGRMIEVLEASPHRVGARCPHHAECGGCGLQHVDAEIQTRAKAQAVQGTLRRMGGVLPRTWGSVWRGPAYGVRSKVRWRANSHGVGQRRRRSHALVELRECPILEPPLEASLKTLGPAWAQGPARTDELHGLTDGTQVWLHARSGAPGLALPGARFVARGQPVEIADAFGVRVASVGSFGQSHRAGNDAMLEQLRAWLSPVPTALELYAGAGNWTRVLQAFSEAIVAVERDEDAARHIQRVAEAAEVWPADASKGLERFLEGRPKRWGLLANPPRTGLGPELPARLRTDGLEWFIYVSCDPATFARDAARLAEHGLSVDEVRVFDLYPQTGHVELMARLVPSA